VAEPTNLLLFANREEWRAWLEEHGASEQEAWLVHYKKKAGKQSLAYEEAVEEALCFGWIDGLQHGIDGEKYRLRYSPRKPGSMWSVSNQRRVERMIAEGRMTAAGLARIAEAKENGQWEAAIAREDVSAVPADLAEALGKDGLLAAFAAWPASRKKMQLYWLNSAKRPETRQKRVQAIVEMARNKE
jgi:uncharacterized protein YdeI (YjbR/CyaY-like superfamily)